MIDPTSKKLLSVFSNGHGCDPLTVHRISRLEHSHGLKKEQLTFFSSKAKLFHLITKLVTSTKQGFKPNRMKKTKAGVKPS